MSVLFPGFLENVDEYYECEKYWDRLVDSAARNVGQSISDWPSWIGKTRVDGEWELDGNPISSGHSRRLSRAFRVIQFPYAGDELAIAAWLKEYPVLEFPHLPNHEVVFNLALTSATSRMVAGALEYWMNLQNMPESIEAFIESNFPELLDVDDIVSDERFNR